MGKTLRLDAKYPNELTKHAKKGHTKTEELTNTSKKAFKLNKRATTDATSRERRWSYVNEQQAGHRKV